MFKFILPSVTNDNVITFCQSRLYFGRLQMHTTTESKRETLNIRIKADVRDLIDRAAKSRGKNRTDFILESARAAAEDDLLDQVIMAVTPQAYAQFLIRLDMPPKANDRLRKTMSTPAPCLSRVLSRAQRGEIIESLPTRSRSPEPSACPSMPSLDCAA